MEERGGERLRRKCEELSRLPAVRPPAAVSSGLHSQAGREVWRMGAEVLLARKQRC